MNAREIRNLQISYITNKLNIFTFLQQWRIHTRLKIYLATATHIFQTTLFVQLEWT